MSKSKKDIAITSANEVALENSTTANLAYQFAKANDTGLGIAKQLFARYPNGLTDETIAEIESGFTLRFGDIFKPTTYRKDGADTYVPVTEPAKDDEVTLTVTLAYAMGLSAHEFGKLKAEQPNLHRIIKEARDARSKYVSKKLIRLQADMKTLQGGGKRETKAFNEQATKLVEALAASARNKKKNGDSTAPEDKAAFKAHVISIIDAMKWA